MNLTKWIEVSVGFLMLIGAGALIFLAIQVSGLSVKNWSTDDYQVSASFSNIGNLKIRAPVRISGVEVGNVVGVHLDPVSFQATVTLNVDHQVNDLPENTSAAITSAGLLGDSFVSLTPGYQEDPEHPLYLKQGSVIATTYSATNLESLISAFVSNGGKS